MNRRKVTDEAIRVALRDGEWSGVLELGDRLRLGGWRTAKLYRNLWSLLDDGVLEAKFADGPYPRRRLYRSTPEETK